MCTCITAMAHLFWMATWQTFQCVCESSEVLSISGSQEPLISPYVALWLLNRELWEKTAFILTSVGDYSSRNLRFCITSNATEPKCSLWSFKLFEWRVPLQRCNGSDLHPSQSMEVTVHRVYAVSSAE